MVPHASITIAYCPTVVFTGKGPVWSHGLHTVTHSHGSHTVMAYTQPRVRRGQVLTCGTKPKGWTPEENSVVKVNNILMQCPKT